MAVPMTLTLSACSSHDNDDVVPDPIEKPDTPQTEPGGGNENPTPTPDPETPSAVKFKTFKGRVMAGYQGWFTAQGDWVGRGWQHLYASGANLFEPGACSIEFWPDMREYTKSYPTPFKCPDGSTATFYSNADPETADLHFKWMQQYGIDGAIIQRFKSTISGRPWMKTVLKNCIAAAEKYGRAFMIEYDLSGIQGSETLQDVIDDWNALNAEFHFTDPEKCPNYLWEKGRPLVGFFGISLNNGKDSTPEQYLKMMDAMDGRDGKKGELSFMAGCGYYWRISGNDAKPFADWEKVFKRCAVISPWAVGRYTSIALFTQKEGTVRGDIQWCKKNNIIYAPVAAPGFSWRNTQTQFSDNGTKIVLPDNTKTGYDQTPRNKGTFFWKQLSSYVDWGADGVFIAMFDEIDEGTAIYKCTQVAQTPINSSTLNPQGKFVSYDEGIDTGYYMFLAGEASKWLKGATGYSSKKPEME